jgi:hypothetical protein
MLAVPLLALTACAGSIPSTDRLRLDPPEASLTQPCSAATRLPDRTLSQAEVEAFWIRDRQRLAQCRSRHGALSQWATEAAAAVNGPPS